MTSAERITALAKTFPTLRAASGLDPWDPDRLDAWAAGPVPSSAGRHAASFVLSVWRPYATWRSGRFDLIEAMACFDCEHRQAVAAWVAVPWWP